MPTIFKNAYGKKPLPGERAGYMEITPTVQRFVEADGSDVRLDRVRVYNEQGVLVRSYLRDKMGAPFMDNLPDTEDDPAYLNSLPNKER